MSLEELAAAMEKWPAKGKRPELYQIHGIMTGLKPGVYTHAQGELLWKMARKVGVNEKSYEKRPGETLPRSTWQDAATLKIEQLYPHLSPDFQPTAEQEKGFQEFLAKKVGQPAEVGLKSWAEVKLQLKDKASLLYYHSHLYLTEQALAQPRDLRGPWSPEPDYWPKMASWVLPYRRKALAAPWSEEISYRVPEFSPMASGYLIEALRCGAREHDLPLTWNLYCDTPGTTPENLRRAYYAALGRGIKQFNFRGAVPKEYAQGPHAITGPGAERMWRTVRDLLHETGQIEQLTHTARPRRADIGLLISFAQELWEPDPDRNQERKALYLAGRIGGYNLEFITEEEIQAGKHKHLRSIITTGNHLERATARELLKFVADGGAFSCYGYSGMRDEHNRPLDILDPALPVSVVKSERKGSLGLPKQNLAALLPVDTIDWLPIEGRKLYGYVLRNSYKPTGRAEVFGTYADKSPAIIRHEHGRGVTWVFGSFIASGFLRDALLPPRPWQPGTGQNDINNFLPTGFNHETGDIVTASCDEARYDVLFNKMMFEALVLEGPQGVAVVLINWSNTPQNLEITLQFAPDYIKKGRSLAQGDLELKHHFKSVTFRARVDVTDVVLLTK